MTERQVDILYYLHGQDHFVPVSDISEAIQVSVKTVRNELIIIQQLLEKEKLGELKKVPRKGILLEIQNENWAKLERLLGSSSFSGNETDLKNHFIYSLLIQHQINYTQIRNELYIGRSAADRMIPELNEWFSNHRIILEKRRGIGFLIHCNEFLWRIAMWELFLMIKHQKKHPYIARDMNELELFLKGFDTTGINKAICSLESCYGFSFGYEAHIQLFFMLSLCIVRTRKNKIVSMPHPNPLKTDGTYTKWIMKHLIEELERGYHIHLPQQEQDFIEFAIDISDIQTFHSEKQMLECETRNIELCFFSIRLISLLSSIVNVNLKTDLFFSKNLFLQLRSMISRLKYGIKITNPLLKQVKQTYPNIFAAVYGAGVYFEKELNLELNEHEMCSLALLLGGAIERSLSVVSACVICDYGIGMSQLLKEQLERHINDLHIENVFSLREISKAKASHCDLIITTMHLNNQYLSKDIVTVDCLMTQFDIKNIENKMKQLRRKKLKTKKPCNQLSIQKKLFFEELIHLQITASDKNELIHLLCKQLIDGGYVTEEFETSVLDHEITAPTALCKGVAIPHGYAKFVIRPVVMVATLQHPIQWQDTEEADIIFLLAFNLDDVVGMKEETIKFYSVFLDLLDEDENVNALRHATNPQYLAEHMNGLIQNAVNINDD